MNNELEEGDLAPAKRAHDDRCPKVRRSHKSEQESRTVGHMSVLVKFIQSGAFHSGEFKSLDLDKISQLKITRQRNTCELLAFTPENPQPSTPYIIAIRENEYELQAILSDLQQLKQGKKDIVYEITDTEVHQVKKV
jgi:hypothetical protein